MAAATDSPEPTDVGVARLARLGFNDPAAMQPAVRRLGGYAERLLAELGRTADPDLALTMLDRLGERVDDRDLLLAVLHGDDDTARRLLRVLGASEALGQHLLRHPDQWTELADAAIGGTRFAAYAVKSALLRAVGADPDVDAPVATLDHADAVDALRVEYYRWLQRIAARDLAHGEGVDDVGAALSDLAVGTLEAALAVARASVGDDAGLCRLAVIALGKCGGHELNYVSDVDVVFVAEPVADGDEAVALKAATRLASTMMQVCSDQTAEGTIWPVDANLRPEGRNGPLVRTLASHLGYYERWAATWEFQALLKARHAAGDAELGAAYVDGVRPYVWAASQREGFVEGVQAMRRRVVAQIPAGRQDHQLKLGPGGLRDVEFAVQLLQLVHGRGDPEIRQPTTLSALVSLTEHGYVGREDGTALRSAYEFLRTLEHRIQIYRLQRTHMVPEEFADVRRIGRSMGFAKEPAVEFREAWAFHRREVRRLHEKLFYRPLLAAVARTPGELRLSPGAARERLAALGYLDPSSALRHLETLTSGVSRRAAIQRTLLPAMLEWFGQGPDPDGGLLGFRQISDALGSTPWYLKQLRDEGEAAQRLAQVLSTSRFATDLLRREPEGVRMLGMEHLAPLDREALTTEMSAAAARRKSASKAVQAIRAIRRRELLRISVADLCEPFGVAEVGYALTGLTDATLEAALGAVCRQVERDRGRAFPTRMAIISVGRYGSQELGYGSDADVMFVHDPLPDADPADAARAAQMAANDLRRLLAAPGSDPALVVDADLRPEGKQGPLVRTLASYAAYYGRWSEVWEAQALLRADPVVGDPALKDAFAAMIDPLRYPEAGLTDDDLREIRRIKARVDAERMPKDADRSTHLKLGRGGLSDIEWTVQLLQLQYAGEHPGLRTTRTLDALAAAAADGLIASEDADVLAAAWTSASRVRNATVQVRGRPSDELPRDARERAAVASVLGYPAGHTDEMVNDYLRQARQAYAVVERVFW